jgi:hypothetical protein
VWGSAGDRRLILAWSGATSSAPDTVEISHSLLTSLGLEPFSQVYVYPVLKEEDVPPLADQVSIFQK